MAATRRTAIYGPEPWAERVGQQWSHWDRWYALVAVTDTDGDLAALAERLDSTETGYLAEDVQAKLAHLDDLAGRLKQLGLDSARLLGGDEVDRTVLAKARRKVLDQALSERDLTDSMRHTPRRRLRERALRGSWHHFPEDPAEPYAVLAAPIGDQFDVWVEDSFALVRDLDATIAALVEDAEGDLGRLLAVRRAALSAVAEAADHADDSYGEIGELGQRTWHAYTGTAWRDLIDPAVYWRDVCELIAFDDYAHLHQQETMPYRHARKREADLLLAILGDLADEYAAARLRWHADEAGKQELYVLVATRSIDRFADAAARLGGGHWRPVASLAEAAIDAGRPEIAAAVFDAADRNGSANDHLRRLRHKLLGETSPNVRHLRVVDNPGP